MPTTHAAVVVVADDGVSPVGTNEWNASHVDVGFQQDDRVIAASETIAANKSVVVVGGLSINDGITVFIGDNSALGLT